MQTQIKTYCIIGDPVQHSLSPAMQNAAFNSLHLNCVYIAFRVSKDELKESICSLRSINIAGFNVTMPHKIDILEYVDELDLTAQKAYAVNTVHNVQGTLKAYNTDVYGFIQPLHRRKINFSGMTILLLGSGGAARAVIAALSEESNISNILIASRNQKTSRCLVDIGEELGLQCDSINIDNVQNSAAKSDLIVNTIPAATNNNDSIIDHEHISKDSIVYDIVYKPILTRLLEQAKHAKAQIVYGYEMLIEQGAKAFEIWTGMNAPRGTMKKALFGFFGDPI
jgi:shikimate dehydrogenase